MKNRSILSRRTFVKNSGLITIAGFAGQISLAKADQSSINKLPKWRGFNMLDFFLPDPAGRQGTPEKYFQWIRDWGFDFVRIPIAYPYYLNIDRSKNIVADDVYRLDERRVNEIEALVHMANKYNLHCSINLHRAPGYCINAGFHEPFNLWRDEEAQKAFYWHWNMWAKRFRSLSPKQISFDLVNEPAMREDMNDQHSASSMVPGEVYRKVAKNAMEAIRKENPRHLVIADGNNVGNNTIPEITDLGIAQSCRGYNPHFISHYKAPWASKEPDKMPLPTWPMTVGEQKLDRSTLQRYYQPWIDLVKKGVGVHCGECGCWNKTPHEAFLAWFGDVLDILTSNGIGYALWNFSGDFGVLNSNRTDVAYENWQGEKLDRKMLTLLQQYK
jgi:endoglucanase